jgi:hypothetical protein
MNKARNYKVTKKGSMSVFLGTKHKSLVLSISVVINVA